MPDRGYAPVSTVLRAARIANSVAFALQGYFLAVILTELPQLRDRLGLSDNTILIIVMAISVVAAAGSLLAEQMAVRWSSRTALCTGLAAITIAGLIFAVAPGITTGLIALICYGLAVGVVDASTNMQAVFIQHGYGRFVFASFYAAWSAGTIAGALFVFACEKAQLTLPYTIAIAAAIVAAAAAISGRRLLGTGRAEADAGTSESVATVRLRAYLALGIAMALVFAIDFAVSNWSALYLTDDLRSEQATATLPLACYQGASLLTRLTGDWWVRRFGARSVVRVGASIGIAGLIVVVAAPGPGTALAGFLIAGLGLPVIAPLCFSEAGRLTGGRGLDSVIARLNLFNYAGTLIGGGAVGGLAVVTSWRIGFVAPLLFAAALIAGARFFRRREPSGEPAATGPGHVVLEP